MNKKIVILSSGQPSANPRLKKEALALSLAGFNVTVLYCPLSPWADEFDRSLFQLHPEIVWIKVGFHAVQEKWGYLFARIRQKYYQILYKLFGNFRDAAIRSTVMFSQELVTEGKKIKADLYIGHNLGALPAVIKAASANQAKAAFDFEDFHRGENMTGSMHSKKVIQIEKKYVPGLTYSTAASPLIAKAYAAEFPELSITAVNNYFTLAYAITEPRLLPVKPLKLFWFSQTVGKNRGLETVIMAMGKLPKEYIALSILGNCSISMKNYFQSIATGHDLDPACLHFLEPVDESEIVTIASDHHIGLACEETELLNRELCLTNKIFMYLLAANAILFTNTRAQSLLLKENPGIGRLYNEKEPTALAVLFNEYFADPDLLLQHRNNTLLLAKTTMNWEMEQHILIQRVKDVLH